MTLDLALDGALVLAAIGLAAAIVSERDSFAAVVGFVVYGLVLALVWVRLACVDVALTEAAIGSGVTGILLLIAAYKTRGRAQAAPPSRRLRYVAAILCTLVTAGLAAVVLNPIVPHPTLAPAAAAGLPATGIGNPVTAVLMDYRAFDTFLEKVVLVLALLGVWSLAPDGAWGAPPALSPATWQSETRDRDGLLAFLAEVLVPIGVLTGFFLFWWGANHPGGAFQAGAILAVMWMLAMVTRKTAVPPVSARPLRIALVVGAGLFLVVGLMGLLLTGAFLVYPKDYAKALIIGIEAAMTVSVLAALALLVAGPPVPHNGHRGDVP